MREFAEGFQALFADRYAVYAKATAILGSHFANNRRVYGDRPPFALDPLPVTMRSLLEAWLRALERAWTRSGALTPAVLADAIPAARDLPLEFDAPNTQRV